MIAGLTIGFAAGVLFGVLLTAALVAAHNADEQEMHPKE